ncbi:MAG: hypothetical protein V4687_03050 [Bacteroidota bacterium]
MKKITSIIFLCFSIIASATANSDTLEVYKAVIVRIKSQSHNEPFNVNITTRKSESFYNLEFIHELDNKGTAIRAKEDWKILINQIDMRMVKDFKLETNGKPWFGRTKPKRKRVIGFSPIIFNTDHSLALVNAMFNGEDELTEIIYYLEKDANGTWKVIHGWTYLYS